MVQFSEILRKKEKKPHSEPSQNHTRKEKVSVSRSRPADEEIEQFGADPQSTVRHNENIKTYYEQLLERARDVRDRVKAKQGIAASPILSILHHITIDRRQLFFPVSDNYFSPLPFVNEDRDGE